MASGWRVLSNKRGWLRLWIVGTLLWWAFVILYQMTHPNLDDRSTVIEGVFAAILYPLAALGLAMLLRWVWRGFASPTE